MKVDDTSTNSKILNKLYVDLDQNIRKNYKRSLPFGDVISDRWERAKRLGFDDGVSIYNSAIVFEPVSVGENTWIGPNVLMDGSGGGVSIGAFCSIAAGVHIYTHDTVQWALTGGKAEAQKGAVSIGNYCYIGAQTVINHGVEIGNHCLVGANSFVNKPLHENGIYVGTPIRRIGDIEIWEGEARLKYYL
ncbi:MAG: acyltransferase [Hyphomonas sp.]|nr:acyltransferase [Hyphomonas sp.]